MFTLSSHDLKKVKFAFLLDFSMVLKRLDTGWQITNNPYHPLKPRSEKSQIRLFTWFQYGFEKAWHGLANYKIPVKEMSNSSVSLAFSPSWLEETRVVHPLKPRCEKSQNILDFSMALGLLTRVGKFQNPSRRNVEFIRFTCYSYELVRRNEACSPSQATIWKKSNSPFYLISVWFWKGLTRVGKLQTTRITLSSHDLKKVKFAFLLDFSMVLKRLDTG